MRETLRSALILAAVLPLLAASSGSAPPAGTWRLTGELSEACSCAVPCTCNFGEAPSPHHFCWALFSLDIKDGHYKDVSLDGIRLAGASAKNGFVWYLDERATAEQEAAVRAIADQIFDRVRARIIKNDPHADDDPQMTKLGFVRAAITQEYNGTSAKLVIGKVGGYEGKYIMGLDGKTPVIVQNNFSWNIQNGIKGKTARFHYKDEHGNEWDMNDTNMNEGQFDWSDTTEIYFQ